MSPNDDIRDEKLSQLYREAAREEPPLKLDSAVLSEARKAVEKRSWWRRFGWVAPLATAAVAMLTVSLVLQMKQQHPEVLAPAQQGASAPIEEIAPAQTVPERAPASEELMKQEPRQREASDAMKQKLAVPPLKSEPSATGVAEPKQETMDRSQMMNQEKAPETDSVAPMANMPAERRAALKPEKILYPESWIAKIRELLKQGRKEEAHKEIEAFRAAYPDYELPDDLD